MTQTVLAGEIANVEGGSEREYAGVSVRRFDGASAEEAADELAVEEPLEIQIGYGSAEARRWKSIAVTMRTPGDDLHLAAGFLVTEGVVRDCNEIEDVGYAEESAAGGERARGNFVRVNLAAGVEVSVANLQRNFYTTSSCGICGKASLLALQTVCPPRAENRLRLSADVVYGLPETLFAAQAMFQRTGGLHGAGLFDAAGRLLRVCEDVGRHNAVDKLVGAEFLLDRLPLRECVLMLSGRVSFELLQKAVMAGIPAVVAVGAPSSLAVAVAKQFDVTLVGFVRGRRCNVYHGAERVSVGGTGDLG